MWQIKEKNKHQAIAVPFPALNLIMLLPSQCCYTWQLKDTSHNDYWKMHENGYIPCHFYAMPLKWSDIMFPKHKHKMLACSHVRWGSRCQTLFTCTAFFLGWIKTADNISRLFNHLLFADMSAPRISVIPGLTNNIVCHQLSKDLKQRKKKATEAASSSDCGKSSGCVYMF